MVPNISTTDLKTLINCVSVIDIRDEEDYHRGHIAGAINVPFEKMLVSFKTILNKSLTYYIYCDTGKLSLKLVQILIKNGYKTVDITGGYEKWRRENKIY